MTVKEEEMVMEQSSFEHLLNDLDGQITGLKQAAERRTKREHLERQLRTVTTRIDALAKRFAEIRQFGAEPRQSTCEVMDNLQAERDGLVKQIGELTPKPAAPMPTAPIASRPIFSAEIEERERRRREQAARAEAEARVEEEKRQRAESLLPVLEEILTRDLDVAENVRQLRHVVRTAAAHEPIRGAVANCTHHSIARGGRPVLDQMRASAWIVLKWLQELYVDNVLIENVPEFRDWGPLGANGRPLRSAKGQLFDAFIEAVKKAGYNVEWRILNAADYGDATTRRRLFILARRPRWKPIVWPKPSHFQDGAGRRRWRAAREIIDWSILGESIFARKKPLARSTIDRIEAGLRRFGGPEIEPFILVLRNNNVAKSIHRPVPTITANGQHLGLVQPFVLAPLGRGRGALPRPVTKPLPTILASRGGGHLVQPFIVGMEHTGANGKQVRSVKDPLLSVTAHPRIALCQPFVLQQQSGGAPRGADKPLPTVAARGAISLCQPFLVPFFGERRGQKKRTHSIDGPVPAVTSHGAGGLVQAFLLPQRTSAKARSVGKPAPTITTTSRGIGLVQPFLVSVSHGEGKGRRAHSIRKPLKTITGSNEYGLVQPFIITPGGPDLRKGRSVSKPLPTVTCRDRMALVRPILIDVNHGKKGARGQGIDVPLKGVTTKNSKALVQPFIVKYYGTAKDVARPVNIPLDTVTTKDRFALVDTRGRRIQGWLLVDILFRMLQPHELAAAMSFPKSYKFHGTREAQVKQIGNAVAVRQARALCRALLEN